MIKLSAMAEWMLTKGFLCMTTPIHVYVRTAHTHTTQAAFGSTVTLTHVDIYKSAMSGFNSDNYQFDEGDSTGPPESKQQVFIKLLKN